MRNPWTHLIRPARLQNKVNGQIQAGYNYYGPTLAISGVLTALNKMILVDHMNLSVTRSKDRSRFQFSWMAFQQHNTKMSGFQESDMHASSRFVLNTGEPYPYHILFFDHERHGLLIPILNKVKAKWQMLTAAQAIKRVDIPEEKLFKEFLSSGNVTESLDTIKRLSYWRPGEFQLKVNTVSTKPKRCYTVKHKFWFDDISVQRLENNAVPITAEACHQAAHDYQFATVSLE